MEDSVSVGETKDNANIGETKENVSTGEKKEKVSIAEMKEKISITVAKEKVSNVAAKGGKAFMSLIHKAKHSPKEHKATASLNDVDSDSDEPVISNSPNSSLERKEKLVSDESSPDSPNSSMERKSKLVDVELTANSPKSSMERKAKLVNRLKQGLKGKKNTNADNRSQLLDEKPEDLSPRVRSADSIKKAYGHKPSTDPTSIAAMNREKLIERQEKLQAMNNQSEEMMEGAENFASMAEDLAKKIENKKWYQL